MVFLFRKHQKMSNSNSPYKSSIDYLLLDPASEVEALLETENDLKLWTNTQFTCDTEPISSYFDQIQIKSPGEINNANISSSDNDFTYEKLLSYIDPESYHKMSGQDSIPPTTEKYKSVSPKKSNNRSQYPVLLPKLSLEDQTKLSRSPSSLYSLNTFLKEKNVEISEKEIVSSEEEKRRRNTAASARFRIKKKLKEQSTERSIYEMTQKSKALQNRVYGLEQEIHWLRSILTERASRSL
ncbi:unnamed protein product [Rhizopus stolonifer]